MPVSVPTDGARKAAINTSGNKANKNGKSPSSFDFLLMGLYFDTQKIVFANAKE